MSVNINEIMKRITEAEQLADAKRAKVQNQIAEIDNEAAKTIAKLNDDAKRDIDAKVAGKQTTPGETKSVDSKITVDKKRHETAVKFVIDSFWSFIK